MHIVTAPPVYDPGGTVALVLNLVEEPPLAQIIAQAKEKGAVLCIVNCPSGDPAETELAAQGFTIASEWYRATVPLAPASHPVRSLIESDVVAVGAMAEARRQQYALYQPVFWRVHPNAISNHAPFLASQISREDVIALACDDEDGELVGYVLADSKGIDDFAVRTPELWETVGSELLRAATERLAAKGMEQFTVVCGHRDIPKRTMLQNNGLPCVASWWTIPLASGNLEKIPEGIIQTIGE